MSALSSDGCGGESIRRTGSRRRLPALPRASSPREARFFAPHAGRLSWNHPHICTIYDIERDGHPFIVMELMKGHSLRDLLATGAPLQLHQLLDIGIELADALHAAHSEGTIHRDIKPGNIFVTERGRVKLLDFGLAKLTTVFESSRTTGEAIERTVEGVTLGTVAYMSPKQATGERLVADLTRSPALLNTRGTVKAYHQGWLRRVSRQPCQPADLAASPMHALYSAPKDQVRRRKQRGFVYALRTRGAVVIGSTIGPYQVLSHIGAGGMGEVYRARDTRLGRDVALKALSAELESPETRERLLHEARAAATLNHPNVASIYDVLESDGRLFLVMEFVEGETLNTRLARGRLRCEELLPIVRQVLNGVGHAHGHGIIHRDLKPANLILTPDGGVKILDFGIARIRSTPAHPTRHGTTTAVPEIAGSPGYAAPEYLLGTVPGSQADLYSVGVLMFHCLTGRLPFNAPDLITSMMAPMTDEPPDFAKVCSGATEDVIAIMRRALCTNPDERFQSAEEMRRDVERAIAAEADRPTTIAGVAPLLPRRHRVLIRWAATAALVIALVVAVSLYRHWNGPPSPEAGTRPVLAVLPLEVLSGDPSSKAWLGAGVAETLGVSLSKLKSVIVISRSDVVDATRGTQDSASIARQLGATLLVAGSIQEWHNRLKVTVRLVKPNGQVIWSEERDAPLDNIFELQGDIAAAVSQQLQVTVSASEGQKVVQQPTASREALTEYWKGQAALERVTTVSNVQSAIDSFARAITLDPNFALAHAALANAYWIQYGETRDRALTAKGTDEAMKALSLDPDQPRVRVSLGVIYAGTGQYQAAEIELRRALEFDPANDEAYRQLAKVLLEQNRGDEAIGLHKKAIAIRPNYWRNQSELGITCLRLGRPAEARDAFKRAIDLQPDNPGSHSNMGIAYAQLGDTASALAEFERANTLAPSRRGYSNLGMMYSEAGRLEDALGAYQQALRLDANSEVTHGNVGDVLVRLGRLDQARREYEIARAIGLKLLQVNDKDAGALSRVAAFEAKLGMRDAAMEHGRAAVALAPRDPGVNYKMAVVHVQLKQMDAALLTLARALENGFSPSLARSDPDLAPLRSRPEFQKLLAPATPSTGEHR